MAATNFSRQVKLLLILASIAFPIETHCHIFLQHEQHKDTIPKLLLLLSLAAAYRYFPRLSSRSYATDNN
jgi:hypothetical protein